MERAPAYQKRTYWLMCLPTFRLKIGAGDMPSNKEAPSSMNMPGDTPAMPIWSGNHTKHHKQYPIMRSLGKPFLAESRVMTSDDGTQRRNKLSRDKNANANAIEYKCDGRITRDAARYNRLLCRIY